MTGHAGRRSVSACKREASSGMVELRRFPRRCRMTQCAVPRKRCRDVVRVRRHVVQRTVARRAILRRSSKLVARVTLDARSGNVGSRQRKTCLRAVVEPRAGPRCGVVA
jgi:hypothetical protein